MSAGTRGHTEQGAVERAAEVIDRLIVAWPNAHGTKLHAARLWTQLDLDGDFVEITTESGHVCIYTRLPEPASAP